MASASTLPRQVPLSTVFLLVLQCLPLIWAVLYILPVYVYSYRLSLTMSAAILSLTTIPFFLISAVVFGRRKQWKLLSVSCALVLFSFFLSSSTDQVRRLLTQTVLDIGWCSPSSPRQGEVLGGLKKDGSSFLNDTSCVLTVCHEELFVCRN